MQIILYCTFKSTWSWDSSVKLLHTSSTWLAGKKNCTFPPWSPLHLQSESTDNVALFGKYEEGAEKNGNTLEFGLTSLHCPLTRYIYKILSKSWAHPAVQPGNYILLALCWYAEAERGPLQKSSWKGNGPKLQLKRLTHTIEGSISLGSTYVFAAYRVAQPFPC